MRKIILASGSPRRRELLEKLGLGFTVIPSDFEEWLDDNTSPEEMAKELGLGKARDIAERYPEAIVIGGDTIVTVDGKQLGKPKDIEEAREMWRICTAAPNKLTTSLAVVCKAENFEYVTHDNAFITFKPYDEAAIEAYLATGDYIDKAGAWSLQKSRHLMESVEGDEEAFMGLPTRLLTPILDKFE